MPSQDVVNKHSSLGSACISTSPLSVLIMTVLPHFSAVTVDEISFVSGEIITNLNQLYVWGTRLLDGSRGFFPKSCVMND